MSYFKKLPKTSYTFRYVTDDGVKPKSISVTLPVVDIFRKVAFTKESKDNPNNYETFTITKGEKPEDIADFTYGDANLWWIILLFNDVIDPFNEWVYTPSQINDKFDDFYKGSSYFFMEQVDAVPGDILIKRDSSIEGGIDIDAFGVISDYDALSHRIDVRGDESTGKISAEDEVYIFRKTQDGNYSSIGKFGTTGCFPSFAGNTFCNEFAGPSSGVDSNGQFDGNFAVPHCATAGGTFGIVMKKTDILDSPVEFSDSLGNPVSFYSGITGIASGENIPFGDFYRVGNICGLTTSVLYKYMTDSLPTTISTKTRKSKLLEDNDNKRTVKVPKANIIGRILNEISDMLSSTSAIPRGTRRFIQSR